MFDPVSSKQQLSTDTVNSVCEQAPACIWQKQSEQLRRFLRKACHNMERKT